MLSKKFFELFFLLLVCNHHLIGQYDLRIIAKLPRNTDKAYVAGSFNSWVAGDTDYRLYPLDSGHMQITIRQLNPGKYEFKCNRGSAASFECQATGIAIDQRTVDIHKDTTIEIYVAGWSDAWFNTDKIPDSLLYEVMEARAGYYVEIDLDSSYSYATRLYSQARKLNDPEKEARALDLQGVIFTRQGNADKALSLFLQSLAIKKAIPDSSGASFTYYSMGELYQTMQDLIKAKNNFLKAISWTQKGFEHYQSAPLTNIGRLYLNSGQVDSASHYVAAALHSDKTFVGALLLKGDLEANANNHLLALKDYKMAIEPGSGITPGEPLYINNAEAYKKMGEVFYTLGLKDSAFYYIRLGFAIATHVKNPSAIISTGRTLVELFAKTSQFDSAFYYQGVVDQNKDNLFTTDKEKQIHNIFFLEKLRQQDDEVKTEKYKSKVKIYTLVAIITLLILTAIAYRARSKATFARQLADIEMRALRAQMNPHFIFNCLTSINRYIVVSDAKTASAYLTKFAKLIRLILDNSANEFISFDSELQTLELYLDMELLRFDNTFVYDISVDNIYAGDSKGIPTMIIQPYVENAIWHGLLHKEEERKLCIRFSLVKANIIQVEIEDNGIGREQAVLLRSKDSLKTKSFGMQISKDRINAIARQHNIASSVTVEDLTNAKGKVTGTKVILQLPFIDLSSHSHTQT